MFHVIIASAILCAAMGQVTESVGDAGVVRIETLDGIRALGRVTRLDAGELEVSTSEGPRAFAMDQLLRMEPLQHAPASSADEANVRVQLIDGSILVAKCYAADQDSCRLTRLDGRVLELSRRAVDVVRWAPLSTTDEVALGEVLARARPADLLVIRRSEALDYVGGLVDAVTESSVVFALGGRGEPLSIPRERLIGIAHSRAASATLEACLCRVRTSDGSVLQMARLDGDARALKGRTVAGAPLTLDWSEVAYVDFSRGNIVRLHELPPTATNWTPYIELHGMALDPDSPAARFLGGSKWREAGGDAVLNGTRYGDAIVWRSRTETVYRLTEPYRRFRAIAGIDERHRAPGRVRFTVHGDERLLFDAVVRPGDPPVALDLDLNGVGRLIFRVDYADDGGFGDWLTLCEARLQK